MTRQTDPRLLAAALTGAARRVVDAWRIGDEEKLRAAIEALAVEVEPPTHPSV